MKETASSPAMPELEPKPVRSQPRRYSLLDVSCYAVAITVVILLLVLGEGLRRKAAAVSERREAVEHCRRIIIGLRLYSPDNGGTYPPGLTDDHGKWLGEPARNSNELFRELFKLKYLPQEWEMIFGCPRSPFHPDGNIGTVPACKEALRKGENHWAMTEGLFDSSPGNLPLVFENPADAGVPPRWNTDDAGKKKPGRCWEDRTVVVGFNNGTVRWMKLEAGPGLRKLEMIEQPDPDSSGTIRKDVFPTEQSWGDPTHILQVDE